jgi:CheY-like chemotaxis protein
MANVLLIDDDTVLLKLYSTRLQADGHQVQVATNGEQGIQALSQFIPNVIILDLLMPKLNGFKFIEQIRQNPNLQNIPIIIFSSVANQEQIDRLRSLGIQTILNKIDITPTQLVDVINQHLTPSPQPNSQA